MSVTTQSLQGGAWARIICESLPQHTPQRNTNRTRLHL